MVSRPVPMRRKVNMKQWNITVKRVGETEPDVLEIESTDALELEDIRALYALNSENVEWFTVSARVISDPGVCFFGEGEGQ